MDSKRLFPIWISLNNFWRPFLCSSVSQSTSLDSGQWLTMTSGHWLTMSTYINTFFLHGYILMVLLNMIKAWLVNRVNRCPLCGNNSKSQSVNPSVWSWSFRIGQEATRGRTFQTEFSSVQIIELTLFFARLLLYRQFSSRFNGNFFSLSKRSKLFNAHAKEIYEFVIETKFN